MTITEATSVIETRACDYSDYEPRSLAEWRVALDNSETNTYEWLGDNIALSATGGIHKYHNHNTSTWMAR